MGEAHVDVLLDRLRTATAWPCEPEDLRVPLRETFGGPARATAGT